MANIMKQINNFGRSLGFLFILIVAILTVLAEETRPNINRNRMGVWFDYSVRYYDHEADNAYSKEDLSVMVNLVSKRFGKIGLDSAPVLDRLPPQPTDHSRVWVPSVAAQHNKDDPSTPVEVLVTFDAAKLMRTSELKSFDVAKYMADSANDIYPGTVKTLMMFSGFSIFSLFYNNVKETVSQMKQARDEINATSSKHYYDLGIFLDLKDCGHFKGSLGQKMKDVLPHIEMVAFLLRPNYHHMSLKPEVIHKMFATKFDDCERKMKSEKPEIKILPVVLWMSRKGSIKNFAQFWEMMSNWAVKNEKEVVMYEAFDTPQGRLISDQGWWRLKDKAEHEIKPDAFIEKVQELNQTYSSRQEYSTEDSSDEDGGGESSSKSEILSSTSENFSQSANSLYVAIVLLCVICILLVAVILGLAWGFHSIVLTQSENNGFAHYQNGPRRPRQQNHYHEERRQEAQPHSSSFDEDNGSVNGSVLEIRDTAPIVAVTYKK